MPYFKSIADPRGRDAVVDGQRVLMFASSDYLGLAHDPRVIEAAASATRRYGTSMSGSRYACGTLDLHHALEAELAAAYGTEAALVLPTGYQTNLAAIGALADRGDHILIDERAHASLIDGARASRATITAIRHEDAGHLQEQLAALPPDAAALVIVDGVYSMDGALCDLRSVVDAARSAGARVLVDDAHAAGVLGNGRGTAAELGLDDGGDLQTSAAAVRIVGSRIRRERRPNTDRHAVNP
jgi:8-amino-7-oxononanoate synthase